MLEIQQLTVRRGNKDVFKNVSLSVDKGELIAVVGSNGVGKSTLALALLGHPACEVTEGSMRLDGIDLKALKTHERAKAGLFLAHQEPPAIPGVSVADALRAMCDALRPQALSTPMFFDQLRAGVKKLHLPEGFIDRPLHEAFSGGEKKRAELLALLILAPKYAILDEIDSGMDAAARAMTKEVLAEMREQGTGFLLISHNESFLQEIAPSRTVSL